MQLKYRLFKEKNCSEVFKGEENDCVGTTISSVDWSVMVALISKQHQKHITYQRERGKEQSILQTMQ